MPDERTYDIDAIVDAVISDNPGVVAAYVNGREKAMGFLVGQCMRESRGNLYPPDVAEALRKKMEVN